MRTISLLTLLVLACGTAATPTPDTATRDTQSPDPTSIARAEVARLVDEHEARRVAIVILDRRDGRVVGLAGAGPDGDAEAHRIAEVGSTIKPLTVAAALDAGLDPNERFDGEGGEWAIDEVSVRDAHPRPSLTVQDVLVASSNVGAAKIVESVGMAPVRRLLDAMGAEVAEDASMLVSGTGIGVRMSPLALARAYVAFANGGVAIDDDGTSRRMFSERAAHTTLGMLEAAVGDEGTGRRARVEGARVGGKTGTVRDGGALFAGVVPVEDPRWVIVVRAEVPGGYGGVIAAPTFSRVAAALLD